MTTKQRILQLLRGSVASRIRFTVPPAGITINHATFTAVAQAIETGRIKVVPTRHFAANVGAEYDGTAAADAPSGQLIVPPIVGREQEGLILHECTHAFFDLKKINLTAEKEESAAYVVDALCFRMTGLTPLRWSNEPHKTAKLVADNLLRQYAAGTQPVPAVDARSWDALRTAVMLNPTYFGTAAGLPAQALGRFGIGWLGPDSYTNDG
jgi:hypothetical protein